MSSVHCKSTSRLHYISTYMFISIKLSKPKGSFQNIGLVNIVFGEDDSAEEVPLEPGGVACLPPLPAAALVMTSTKNAVVLSCLPGNRLFPCYAISLSVFDPSTRTGFAHNLKCGAKNGISDGYSTVVP